MRELEEAAKGRAEMTVSKETTLLKDKMEQKKGRKAIAQKRLLVGKGNRNIRCRSRTANAHAYTYVCQREKFIG